MSQTVIANFRIPTGSHGLSEARQHLVAERGVAVIAAPALLRLHDLLHVREHENPPASPAIKNDRFPSEFVIEIFSTGVDPCIKCTKLGGLGSSGYGFRGLEKTF